MARIALKRSIGPCFHNGPSGDVIKKKICCGKVNFGYKKKKFEKC